MLRKTLITLGLIALAAATASAGLLPSYGVKAGVNVSDVNTEDLEASTRTGYAAGFFLDLASPLLHLQGELLYTTKGGDGFALNTSPYDIDYRNHFIEIPVLIKTGLPLPMVSPSVYIGPAVSIPVKSEMTDRDGEWIDVKDFSKDRVWSLVIGADVTLMDKLMVDIRYDIGLSSVNDLTVGDIINDINDETETYEKYDDIKDRTFTVLVGWRF